jgi:putative DNA primase/helicase
MLVALVGKNNISALSLHELEGDRFAKAVLLGKLANVCPDLPSAHLSETSVFKAVTGGDELSAEYKYGDKFNFRPFAKLVFSANEPPRSDDSSHGFFRRWQVIPFSRTFQAGARGTIPRIQLDAMLADPTELSGVLNKALEALVVLRQRGDFTQSESMTAAWRDFKRATDPLSVFLDAYTVDDVDGFIIKEILIDLYSRQCFAAGRRMMTHKAFGAALKAARKDVELDKTRTIAGRVRGVYLGIRLVGETT